MTWRLVGMRSAGIVTRGWNGSAADMRTKWVNGRRTSCVDGSHWLSTNERPSMSTTARKKNRVNIRHDITIGLWHSNGRLLPKSRDARWVRPVKWASWTYRWCLSSDSIQIDAFLSTRFRRLLTRLWKAILSLVKFQIWIPRCAISVLLRISKCTPEVLSLEASRLGCT